MLTYKEMPKQYVGFITDHSGSMAAVENAAKQDYNTNIETLKEETNKHELDTIIFSVLCGIHEGKSRYNSIAKKAIVNSTVNLLKPLKTYPIEGMTPLYDAVGLLIELMASVPDVNSPNVSFLIIAVTDGMENNSKIWNANSLSKKINTLQQSDRWTFTFRTPKGYSASLQRDLGIPAGNFYEWETTIAGLKKSNAATVNSISNYYIQRSKGVKSTGSFYTDLSNISVSQVKKTLTDITNEITAFAITSKFHDTEIKEFIKSRHKGTFIKGAGFYELMKREKIQEYKQLVIEDKTTGKFYGGQHARTLLGLGLATGTVNVNPGDHGDFNIFVQSTSINRKLKEGTTLVWWPRHYLKPITTPSSWSWR